MDSIKGNMQHFLKTSIYLYKSHPLCSLCNSNGTQCKVLEVIILLIFSGWKLERKTCEMNLPIKETDKQLRL